MSPVLGMPIELFVLVLDTPLIVGALIAALYAPVWWAKIAILAVLPLGGYILLFLVVAFVELIQVLGSSP